MANQPGTFHLPLPGAYQTVYQETKNALFNARLFFERGASHWDKKWTERPGDREPLFQTVAKLISDAARAPILNDLRSRREEFIKKIGGTSFTFVTTAPLVVGLGGEHVLEAGFCLDRNLGVPYLPGSSIKGMVRAWAEQWEKDDELLELVQQEDRCASEGQANGSGARAASAPHVSTGGDPSASSDPARRKESRERVLREIFGLTDDAGSVIFFDAFPLSSVRVELDVMTPHYPSYYRDRGKDNRRPPDGTEDPVPILFLIVPPEQSFRFSLAHRWDPQVPSKIRVARCKLARKLLENALRGIGIGAKTAIGYGRMK